MTRANHRTLDLLSTKTNLGTLKSQAVPKQAVRKRENHWSEYSIGDAHPTRKAS